ncbi:sulfatase [Maribacter halichondriae]|uniref:sulfatase n=1 Tax=Maribacter halichondriae TaxID=2980554 RepID=UPI002358DC7E|nr:sulfatase [Maribacter sp. Hal144]
MSKYYLVFTVMAVSLLGCKEEKPFVEKQSRPNVLFIAVDDLRSELGAYGKNYVISPNMDALASEGSIFLNHYVQVPTCGASRHALLTGYRPWKKIHLQNNAIEKELSDKPEDSIPETFIHRLKQEGYHTIGIGKISHSADGYIYGYEEEPSQKRELPHSWSELLFDSGKWKTGWNAFFGYADGENRQSLKKQVKPYEAGEVNDEGYPDGITANLAISKLRELKNKNKPFFMGVGFFKPHLPFNAPKEYWDMYEPDSIPISENPNIPENINLKSLHESGEFNQYALGDEKASLSKSVSDEYAKKLRHAYLASISYVDAQIGKLMKELKSSGLDKNTIIVIWGDHGWHLGDQRVWGKHTLFENALKSTLIIKSPYMDHAVLKVENIVETVDLYPTILELCALESNKKLDGESLVRLMENTNGNFENIAYSYYYNGISMRTDNYRFTKYFRDEEPILELYDHTKDLLETENVASKNEDLIEELLPMLQNGNSKLYMDTPQN